jgi:hypothetical protein
MRTTILSLLLAALAFPGTAAAEKLDVEGPLAVKGHGPLRGELKMANPSESKPVVFGGQVGFVRFIDLSGDLKVRCKGRGEAAARENEEGQKVYTCKGRGGRARVNGSHFRIALFAMKYGILIPEGTTGTLQGKFRVRDEQADAQGDQTRADRLKERQERLKERAEKLEEKQQGNSDKPAPPTDEEIEEAIDEAGGDE